MSAATKVQLSAGALGSATVVDASATRSASSLLTPFQPQEAAQARSFLEVNTLRGGQHGGGHGPIGGGPGRGPGFPNIPRVPAPRPHFPQGPNRFPDNHHRIPPYYPIPLPIPVPIPRWPSPYPFPNQNLRQCLPGEIPDYYDRYGNALCYDRWYF